MSIRVSSNQMVYSYQKQLNEANNRQDKLLEQGDGSKLRMSYATSDENIVEAIRRIKEALEKLK